MKKAAIVLAAGQGKRMGGIVPKQYLTLAGKPILQHTLEAFERSSVDDVILVTGEQEISYCREHIVEPGGFRKVSNIIAGGAERYLSVFCGLKAVDGAQYVLVHDGARPFITPEQIDEAADMAQKYEAVAMGMPVKDTVKRVDAEGFVMETPPRKYMWQVQTPQAFHYEKLCRAYEKVIRDKVSGITDDAMVWEYAFGIKVKMLTCSYENIKITTPEDIYIGEAILSSRK